MANTLGISTAYDLAEMASDIPAVLVFAGQTVTGIMSAVERNRDIDETTDLEVYVARFQCSRSDLVTLPAVSSSQVVSVDGVKFYVDGVQADEYGETVLIDLRRVQ